LDFKFNGVKIILIYKKSYIMKKLKYLLFGQVL